MSREPFLTVLRELARCYQAFESYSGVHIRALGLTPPQFDIVATLGNTAGMSFKELGEKTLITKGTLTGVVDRLEVRGLARRVASREDRRIMTVCLTEEGERLFQSNFGAHLEHLRAALGVLSPEDLARTEAALRGLREAFSAAAIPRARGRKQERVLGETP